MGNCFPLFQDPNLQSFFKLQQFYMLLSFFKLNVCRYFLLGIRCSARPARLFGMHINLILDLEGRYNATKIISN